MRILYVTWADIATTDYPLFLSDALKRAGAEIYLFAYDLEYFNTLRARLLSSLGVKPWEPAIAGTAIRRRVDAACVRFRPEVILVGGSFLRPEDVARLQSKFHCVVGFILGYNNLMEGSNARSIGVYDFVYAVDSYIIPILKGVKNGKNPNVFWKPALANPGEHRPLTLTSEDRRRYGADVVFIGGASAHRVEGLRRLVATGANVRIWGGSGFGEVDELRKSYSPEPVYGLTKTKIYNAASIILNVMDPDKEVNSISERVPEALSCGGFVLSDFHADLPHYFPAKLLDAASYRNWDEMVERVDHFLCHPEERCAMSQVGRQHILDHMTYDKFARQMIEQIRCVLESRVRHRQRKG